MTLNEFFAAHPKCALGFSGGVDSAYLLYAGVQAGADIRPGLHPGVQQIGRVHPAGEAQGALGMGCEKLVQRHV